MRYKFSAIFFSVLAIAAIVVCTSLGFWQLVRAEEKQLHLQQLQKWNSQQVTPLVLALDDIEQAHPDSTGRIVSVEGKIWPKYWLLDNQVLDGKVGYDVLVAMKRQGQSRWLLVNLGFVPAPPSRAQLVELALPEQGKLEKVFINEKFQANITLSEHTSEAGWPKRVQQIDLGSFSEQVGLSFHPFIGFAQQPFPEVDTTPHYEPITLSAERHFGYAVQWFLLAFAAAAVWATAFYKSRKAV